MPDIIQAVQSIASADGWFFGTPPPASIDGAIPVACFALVSVVSTEHPTLGTSCAVIALSQFELGNTLDGQAVTDGMTNVVHAPELG